ncbi:PucR family transcriptional regulator [Sporolactobacillus terrae]|uniref:PucR family transcriptional regulator n=1 Tax=Sporolactobacillus terrae TaxID=269673 RepID=A0ABX5Q5H5_9BACL|nr:PucR family transcriptional regulator [Sporolactobacillus terrae]QAA21883.1 PucR family transcriptional regulator [Sporolactobacillus terrae]QAA24856.1 PucR family transcriptional regulator [Sporolactobacillus terrae]UAK16677.1 PucR family transcriptional regulator ligand-binding domain-containing protein [Sporolactobacillus terrae]
MRVSELFQIPIFSEFKLIAGEKGVDRELQNVNMMDAPDIIDYLKPNDWLITTGYHLRNNPDFFYTLVAQMAERGCAALGIKTRRFMNDIPEAVVQLANACSFPLIDLPNSLSLVDIGNQTLTQILNTRTKELQFAIDTHQQFTEHIMSGESTDRLLKRLSDMIGFPTILLDSYLKIIAASNRAFAHGTFSDRLADFEQTLFQQKANFASFSQLDTRQTYSLFVIYTYKKKRCFLLVCGHVPLSDRLLTLTVEQAMNVLAFELMKDEALKQTERKVRDAFFTNLILGAFSTSDELISRATEFGLADRQRSVCVVGELDADADPISYTHFQMETDEVYAFLEGEIAALPFAAHLFVRDHSCAVIFEVVASGDNGLRFLTPYLKKIQERVVRFFSHTLSFGLSHPFSSLEDLPNAFHEAADALHAGAQMGKRAFLQIYQSRGIRDLLHRIPTEELSALYEQTLQALAHPKKEEEQVLLHTLFVYLESNCQISETAKKLFVHRNTVIYRIDKCENLLGADLKDPDTIFQIRFALRMKPLIERSSATGLRNPFKN